MITVPSRVQAFYMLVCDFTVDLQLHYVAELHNYNNNRQREKIGLFW